MRARVSAFSGLLRPLGWAVIWLFALATSALGQENSSASLDNLFVALKRAPDAASAQPIVDQIWARWTHPEDAVLADRMDEVLALRGIGHLTLVLERLDEIVADYPDYAEGWNQRATVHFLLNDHDASLADIEKTLALEPRHFGALSGRAMIYLGQGKRALALKDMSRALQLHPYLGERALFPELLDAPTQI